MASPESPPPTKKQKLSSDDSLHSYRSEEDVGITEHANNHPGFFGIVKARYSDFIVHEISRDNKVVHLTDLSSLPAEPVQSPSDDLLSHQQHSELSALLDGTVDKIMIDVDDCDKEYRTQIHKAIRHFYPKLSSTTTTGSDGGHKCIEVTKTGGGNRSYRSSWPQDRGDYCQFVLYKENIDTVDAVGVLARKLRVKPKSIQYGGSKDKRGITSQLVTCYRVDAKRLQQVNSVLSNIKVGNFEYVKDGFYLGSLTGNSFTIALRNATAEDNIVDEAVQTLQRSGFINYFGMQRFGTAATPTHAIGKCILLEDWLGAIEKILQPRSGDSEAMVSIKQEWWQSRDPVAALAKAPCDKSSASSLLQGLVKHGPWKDYVNALQFIPRGQRLMYVHSYQSLIWNKVASRRVKQFGLEPIVGDLVINSDNEAQCVTTDNISSYTIDDIVLPLPGYSVTYPNNEVGQWYSELLAEDELTSEKLQCRVKDYSLSGNYRPLIIKPNDITWSSIYYDDTKTQLLESDKDKLDDVSMSHPACGTYKAVIVNFSLPAGCYATMLLREVLKKDTSWTAQNKYMLELDIPELASLPTSPHQSN